MKPSRLINCIAAAAILAALLPQAHPAAAQAPKPKIDPSAQFVPGEVVVTFGNRLSASANQPQARALAGDVGAQVIMQYDNIALLSVDPQADVPALVAQLSASGQVQSAQPNYVYAFPETGSQAQNIKPLSNVYTIHDQQGRAMTFTRAQLSKMRSQVRKNGVIQTIPAFPLEFTSSDFNAWGWDDVEGDVIWRNSSPSPAVCEIDSGVDTSHPDLYGKVIRGLDFVNDDAIPNDDNGHGTHVAGIMTALSNNKANSAIGISNGKVVAVKAMNAQGYGTSISVSASIRYCANRTDVRVINMSLGSSAKDPLEYASLEYAINEKNKLVVVSAGNGGTSDPSYPAAWSYSGETKPDGLPNTISAGLVSVAAGRSYPAYVRVWVDKNGNGIRDLDEWFDGADCATDFTNYGKYVSIVAPGDEIYSTQPVSATFFNNYYYGYPKNYAYYSGTSMAAPYVAAAAARTLGAFPTLNNTSTPTLKERLIEYGRPLTFAYEPNGYDPAHPIDPKNAYASAGRNYGVLQDINPLVSGDEYVKAPFCWPKSPSTPDPNDPYGADQNMGQATYLDVSGAMGRVGFYAEATDASTGLPLVGAKMLLLNQAGTVVLDTAIVGSASAGVFMENIPLPTGADPVYYQLYVSKLGYTSGLAYVNGLGLENPEGKENAIKGGMVIFAYNTIAVPPAKNIWVVLDWDRLARIDLDLQLRLPQDAHDTAGAVKGLVNTGNLADYLSFAGPLANLDLERGALFNTSLYGLGQSPYAQLMHNGGVDLGDDWLTYDAIQIRSKPGITATLPYYTAADIAGAYDVFVTDFSGNYGGRIASKTPILTTRSAAFAYPIVRVWYKGRLINWAYPSDVIASDTSCQGAGAGLDWWHVFQLKGAAVNEINQCGNSSLLNYP